MRCRTLIALLMLSLGLAAADAQPPKPVGPAPVPAPKDQRVADRADDELARLDAELARMVAENDRKIAALSAKFKIDGKELTKAKFSPETARGLAEQAGVQFVIWRVLNAPEGSKGGVILAVFSSPEFVDHAVKHRLPGNVGYVACGNGLAVQACPTDVWEKVAGACSDPAAKKGRSPERTGTANKRRIAMDNYVHAQLDTISNQMELFRAREGDYPDVLGKQWKELMSGGYVRTAPKNPFSPAEVTSKIVRHPAKGIVLPEQAGWTFDPETGQLWATGIGD